jgi:fucose permease
VLTQLKNASANGFVGSLKEHVSTKLSFIHASYGPSASLSILFFSRSALNTGMGAFAAPLAATHFASQRRWSFHFLLSLAIALAVLVLVTIVYRFKTLDRTLLLRPRNRRFMLIRWIIHAELLTESGHEPNENRNAGSKYGQIFRIKAVHLLALFALIYVGTEVTLGGKSALTARI